MLLGWITNRSQELSKQLASFVLSGITVESPAKEIKIDVRSHLTHPLSFQPKGEVVKGLLLDQKLTAVAHQTIIGERYWRMQEKGDVLPWTAPISSEDIGKITPPGNFESCFIANFLSCLSQMDELNLDYDRFKYLNTRSLSPSKIHDGYLRSVKSENAILQPVFAYELKQVLENYPNPA